MLMKFSEFGTRVRLLLTDRTIWRRTFLLLLIASILAVCANALRPDSLAWVIDRQASLNPAENVELGQSSTITMEKFKEAYWNMSAFFVDARKEEEYQASHLEGSINIPSVNKEDYLDEIFMSLPMQETIIVYCEGGDCASSHEVFEFLAENGYPTDNLRIFTEGFLTLEQEGVLPIIQAEEASTSQGEEQITGQEETP